MGTLRLRWIENTKRKRALHNKQYLEQVVDGRAVAGVKADSVVQGARSILRLSKAERGEGQDHDPRPSANPRASEAQKR